MTDFASLLAADRGQKARPIHLVDKQSFAAWTKGRPAEDRALLAAHRFDGKTGFAFVLLPRGGDFEVVSAVKNAAELSPWCLAKLAESLPEGTYKLADGEAGQGRARLAARPAPVRRLLIQEGRARAGAARAGHRRAGEDRRDGAARRSDRPGPRPGRTRPPPTLGPAELEQAVRDEAEALWREAAGHFGRGAGRRLSADRRGRPGRRARSARRA